MKGIFIPVLSVLWLFICSCSTPLAPQAYHITDSTALVIESLDSRTSRILQPAPSGNIANELIINQVRTLPHHQTAIIILQNYSEAQVGSQFRNRATPWFIGLRSVGYSHIVFLQGNGQNNPEGLTELAKYD